MRISANQRTKALTLIEVVIVLGLLVILAALLLPALYVPRSRSPQVNCVFNLKQVGLAWLLWVNDQQSGQLPFRVPVANGGTFGNTDLRRNNAWWQYSILSNELSSPKTLVCPSDKAVGLPRTVATNWSASDRNGG